MRGELKFPLRATELPSAATALRAQRTDLRFKRGNPTAVRFDRADQAVKGGVQIVVALIGKRNRQLSSGVTNELKIAFFGEHRIRL